MEIVVAILLVGLIYAGLRYQMRSMQGQLLAALSGQQEAISEAIRRLADTRAPVPEITTPVAKAEPKLSEDKLMVIGAVLACHFGKRVKIRSARRVMLGGGSNVWSQQGRAAVQASHSSFR